MYSHGQIDWGTGLPNELGTSMNQKQYHIPSALLESGAPVIRSRFGPCPRRHSTWCNNAPYACISMRRADRNVSCSFILKQSRACWRGNAPCLWQSRPHSRSSQRINTGSWARKPRQCTEYPLTWVTQGNTTVIDSSLCSKCSANKMEPAPDSIQSAAINKMEGHKASLIVLLFYKHTFLKIC